MLKKFRFMAFLAIALCMALPLAASGKGVAPVAVDSSNPETSVAEVTVGADVLTFAPVVRYSRLDLTVTGPVEFVYTASFEPGETVYFDYVDQYGAKLPDGSYNFELRTAPLLDKATLGRMEAAREVGDESVMAEMRNKGRLGSVQSGTFTLKDGAALDPSLPETQLALRDIVHADDVIITGGSLCVGFDCVNGESFGFDTIRLKENNLRIKFEDTSTSSGFPSRDWQITANDSASGGANKFSIDDIDGGRTPFTIEAGAPSHSLYVDDGGRLGLKTSTPVVELHIKDGNTPTIRLEQDSSSGFQAQTWDLAGNETNFFVRDVTNGSLLPFRIRPGAPKNSIYIDTDGDVGLGTQSPAAALHINRSTGGAAEMIRLTNNGGTFLTFENTSSNDDWFFTSQNANEGDFIIDSAVEGASDGPEFSLDVDGNLVLAGTVTAPSDRNLKHNIVPVDAPSVLARVADLPISEWSYKSNHPSWRHIGPMAQDFYATFGLDGTDKQIVLSDLAGVALAAIQGLNQDLKDRDRQIRELEARLASLEARLPKQ